MYATALPLLPRLLFRFALRASGYELRKQRRRILPFATWFSPQLPLTARPRRRPFGEAPAQGLAHAPVHRLSENGVYMVTAGTSDKKYFYDTETKRDPLERMLLSKSKHHGWQLEAWAVMANHYHFVARGNPDSTNLGEFLRLFHYDSACALNLSAPTIIRP